jgi:predicted metalloprotease with PDZ domain
MKTILYLFFLLVNILLIINSQTYNTYSISFENAVHHEANIEIEFTNIENDVFELRMSRSSPGRYALHEFAKNVYNVKAVDENGKELEISRPNPYQWNILNHNGTVKVSYTLFGNRSDGTYTQIDETHAHLNIPATFMFAPVYEERPIKIKFNPREDLNWKIATQLKSIGDDTYFAKNLDYFMDSPTELSNHSIKSFKVSSNNKEYKINFVLHHQGTDEEFNQYFEKVKKIVLQEMKVYGELPDFDYGEYTFLACYIQNASGDGMEHRNSTILTNSRSLAEGGMERNVGTVSHEFFHSWNVERIRPKTLEPFDYEATNMSGELWFAEGFTSYYTNLILCRSGIISQQKYIEGLAGNLNYVWNSPAREYFNPIEMSYQAPLVDAACSVDPVNRENTFISYYSYGSVLGLALDLSLRNLEKDKNLDDFMKLVWQTYGKSEKSYSVKDIQDVLSTYAGNGFSNNFFSKYIFDSKMPDYKKLFSFVGVNFNNTKSTEAYLGADLIIKNGIWVVDSNPLKGYASYNSGLSFGDEIISIDGKLIKEEIKQEDLLKIFQPGQSVSIVFNRYGEEKETQLTFDKNPSFTTSLIETVDKKTATQRENWLNKTD